MDLVETRELAYFVAVAEELHFGRAARRLGIAQPPLSRAIKQLERRLGVTLLNRGRQVTLTEAGEVLLAESRTALTAVTAAVRRTRRAGQTPQARLVLAMKPGGDGGLLPGILAAYRALPGMPPVEVVCSVAERAAMLRDGRADLALLYGPREDLTGLDTEPLLTEPQVAVLPSGHRLAHRSTLTMADLHDQTMPRWPHLPDIVSNGPPVHDIGQLMQLIALGEVVAVLPDSVRGHLRHDLHCVPVTDAPTTTLLLGWPEGSQSRPLASFVHAATAVAAHLETPRPYHAVSQENVHNPTH